MLCVRVPEQEVRQPSSFVKPTNLCHVPVRRTLAIPLNSVSVVVICLHEQLSR